MSFVYEKIPHEEWPRIEKSLDRYKNWGVSGHWRIDRERDIILRRMSAGHTLETSKTSFWLLFWQGNALWFTAEYLQSRDLRPNLSELLYEISDLKYPESFTVPTREIYQIILEGLNAKMPVPDDYQGLLYRYSISVMSG